MLLYSRLKRFKGLLYSVKNAVEWKIVKFKFVEITSLTHRGSLIYFVNLSLSEFHLLVEANISARLEKQFLLQ